MVEFSSEGNRHVKGILCEIEGQASASFDVTSEEPSTVVTSGHPVQTSSLDYTRATGGSLHRRFSSGVGLPFFQRISETRYVVSSYPKCPHKSQRDDCSMDCPQAFEMQEGNVYSDPLRQQCSSLLSEQGRVSQVRSPVVLDPFHHPLDSGEGLVPLSGACEGSQQRVSGCSIQRPSSSHRMESGQTQLSVDPSSEGEPSNRLICHKRELQALSLYFPHFGPESGGNRCLQGRLEPLGNNLSLSPGQDVISGSTQVRILSGPSSPGSSLLAQPALVSETSSEMRIPVEDSQTNPVSDSSGQEAHSRFLYFLGFSRLEI